MSQPYDADTVLAALAGKGYDIDRVTGVSLGGCVEAFGTERVGVIVNGERFAPGYTREAAEYEQRTRPQLPITVPQAIRLHGYLTEIIARDRHKRDMLVSLRIGLSAEPDLSEGLLASNITDNERLLANLSTLLYGEGA